MIKIDKNWKLPNLAALKGPRIETSYLLFNMPKHLETLGKGRYYFIRTYGCQANERDSETIAGVLEKMGFTFSEDIAKCDLVILNTCAVRKNAEDKVIGEIGALKKYKVIKPELVIAMAGCMAQEEEIVKLVLSKHKQVNLIFGTHNIHNLPTLLERCFTYREKVVEVFSDKAEVVEDLPVDRFKDHKAWINIMYGCDKFCTYCIVPYTRGKERSREMSAILSEVKLCKDEGFKEITLLGQNVNAYGKDLKIAGGFAALLAEVAKIGIPRVRFVTSHPWDFTDEMIEVMGSYSNIMPYLHLPVQSGNNEILRRMGRRYSVEQYLELFDKLKKRIPGLAFSSDVIVGFPKESKEQFLDTLKVIDYCKFDNVYSFIYSPREQTPASLMDDDVPLVEKKERLKLLNDRFKAYALENSKKYLGCVEEVLVDGLSKTDKNVYSGYTRTNKLVNFKSDKVLTIGDFVNVKIEKAKTFTLEGEVV